MILIDLTSVPQEAWGLGSQGKHARERTHKSRFRMVVRGPDFPFTHTVIEGVYLVHTTKRQLRSRKCFLTRTSKFDLNARAAHASGGALITYP